MRRSDCAVALFSLFIIAQTTGVAASPQQASRRPASVAFASRVPLRGRIFDPTKAPIAGARVTAVPDDGGLPLSGLTGPLGDFELMLQPGAYTVSVAAPGFAETSRPVNVSPSDTASREFILQLADVREEVSVTARAAGYEFPAASATRTATPLGDVPESITVVTKELMADQSMSSVADVVRYVPGISAHQGENNRDEVVIRGNRSSADFFVNGVRDDVQYYRDLYNVERVEAVKGPNALLFGRGGGGGIVNRVLKEAGFQTSRAVTAQGGDYGYKRLSFDIGQRLTTRLSMRVNAMLEDSGSFRDAVHLRRSGINPTITFLPDSRTKITVAYEHLRDRRVADRGITSYNGRPADVARSTYYGDPAQSHVRAEVDLGSALAERQIGGLLLRNRTSVGGYDRFYQNFVPGAMSPDGTQVSLSAYNNATRRTNVFNQTDLSFVAATGVVKHTVLAGAEIGRQLTDNFRNTGYFENHATIIRVPFDNPRTAMAVSFQPNATDADNHVRAGVAAAFVQDQAELSRFVQAIGGLRADRFNLQFRNNRTGDALARTDTLVSPRAGVVLKPVAPLSLYGSFGVSYLPSSGDQFSSLTRITEQVKPERFTNYEVGAKWDVRSALAITAATYRLDRTNTRATDPSDLTRVVQTGSQRTNGFEAGVNGRMTSAWAVAGGYAYQDAWITSSTTSARAGAEVAQVPHHTFSLWNNYRFTPRIAAGLGIVHRSDMFAAIDNTVVLPAYTTADAAVSIAFRRRLRLQVNGFNLFDRNYFVNADNNTNISPGAPRTIRIALTTAF